VAQMTCTMSMQWCMSVTLAYCVETTELIIKQLALDCRLGTQGIPSLEAVD